MRRSFLFPFLLMATGPGAVRVMAAVPVFTHANPAGLQVGTIQKVTLTGKFDPWPCGMYTSDPGVVFTPRTEAGTFDVTVDCGVSPGPILARAWNAEGASAPVALMISGDPQTAEQEPNDDYSVPQQVEGQRASINGCLGKSGDIDSYQLFISKGSSLVAWVEAYVLAAGADTMLRVLDEQGDVMAFNHDGPATMDPLLVFEAPESGKYVVQIMGHKYPAGSDIRFEGGADCVYRLHLDTGPVLRNPWPLAIPQTGSACAAEGWNLGGEPSSRDARGPWIFSFPVSSGPEWTEGSSHGNFVIPSAVSGRISAPGEEDRYPIHLEKDEFVHLAVTGPSHGSAIDAWLKVVDAEGKELAANDDAGESPDPELVFKAPETGIYTAVTGDLTQRGGAGYYYRLQFGRPLPSVKAVAPVHSYTLAAGTTLDIKVSVTMSHGFGQALQLKADDLPPGVSAPAVPVPEKGGETVLTLTSEKTAPPAGKPIRLMLVESTGGTEYPVVHEMISSSLNNGVPQGYQKLLINDTTGIWLTVLPPAPPEDQPKKAG